MLQALAAERHPGADFYELSGRPHVDPDPMHLAPCILHPAPCTLHPTCRWDVDRSGSLDFKELDRALKRGIANLKGNLESGIEADDGIEITLGRRQAAEIKRAKEEKERAAKSKVACIHARANANAHAHAHAHARAQHARTHAPGCPGSAAFLS